jgi:hypothetical protein
VVAEFHTDSISAQVLCTGSRMIVLSFGTPDRTRYSMRLVVGYPGLNSNSSQFLASLAVYCMVGVLQYTP